MTIKSKSLTATYVKDTAKGKKHFSLDSDGIAGAIYLNPQKFKELGEPSELKVSVEGA